MSGEQRREDELQAFESGQNIRDRTRGFAIRVVEFCKALNESGPIGRNLSEQLAKSSNSVAANLEEARAAESTADFISKCCIALKECRESHARLRIAEASALGPADEAHVLCAEANELVAIITAIVRNTKRNAARKAACAMAERAKEDGTKRGRSNPLRIPNS